MYLILAGRRSNGRTITVYRLEIRFTIGTNYSTKKENRKARRACTSSLKFYIGARIRKFIGTEECG